MSTLPASVRKGLENALHRTRSPARLNSVIELDTSLKKLNKLQNKLNQLHRIMVIHNSPGRTTRPRGHHQRTNNNASWNRYMQKYQTTQQEYQQAHREVRTQGTRFLRSMHMPGGFVMPVQLRQYVNQYKHLLAQKVIARRIERASVNPHTKLGKAMLARAHEKTYSPSEQKRRQNAARRIQTVWRKKYMSGV